MSLPLLGLFGGTFDPIHNGHLAVAHGLLALLPFEQIQLIPCGLPPHHKHPSVSLTDRVKMIRLAIENEPHLTVNTIEIDRQGTSYTIDTVKACYEQFPNHALCLILATDVFSSLSEWQDWQNILNYCHFIIVERPQFSIPKEDWMSELLTKHETKNPDDLSHLRTGKILFQHATPSTITSTEIRALLSEEDYDAVVQLLPPVVLSYIKSHKLYKEVNVR